MTGVQVGGDGALIGGPAELLPGTAGISDLGVEALWSEGADQYVLAWLSGGTVLAARLAASDLAVLETDIEILATASPLKPTIAAGAGAASQVAIQWMTDSVTMQRYDAGPEIIPPPQETPSPSPSSAPGDDDSDSSCPLSASGASGLGLAVALAALAAVRRQ